jgi:hypothetical protein
MQTVWASRSIAYGMRMSQKDHAIRERPEAEAATIDNLVKRARAGSIRMPRFQRTFRWNAQDVSSLFDSIWRGYPIGSLLLWERGAPAESVSFGSFHVAEAPQMEDALWVVDGQQRLTTLVATLTRHEDLAPAFELYFDLEGGGFVRRGVRREPLPHWLALNVVLDTSQLLDRLLKLREEGLDQDAVERARELASRIGDYRVPLSIVRTTDEQVLREIFHRTNSAGHRMTSAEVFRALHAALEPGDPGDFRTLVDEVGSLGFGAPTEDVIVRCVLAVRGGDIYRSFEDEFAIGEDPAEAFRNTSDALARAFVFMREDASIPHLRALPYIGVLPILARFFALHPDPNPRTRNLLRRWIWRGSMAWGRDVGELRRAVQVVSDNEQESIARLLQSLEVAAAVEIDLDAVQLNKAATKMNIALLASLQPLDLRDGSPVDVGDLLETASSEALLEVVAKTEPRLAGRLLHPAVDEGDIGSLLVAASPEVLDSHAIPERAVQALLADAPGEFASLRATYLRERLREERERLAEPEASDRPPLSTLVLTDP